MSKYLLGLAILILIGGGAFLFYKPTSAPKTSNPTEQSYITSSIVASIATSSKSSSTYHVVAQIPGASAFDISYPSEFGIPTITTEIRTPSKIDFENNAEDLIFYKPGSLHTYPQAGSQFFLHISLFTVQLQPGQTLKNFVDTRIVSTDTAKLEYSFMVGERQAIAQTINKTSQIMEYYILLDNNIVLNLLFGLPGPRGTQVETDTLRSMEDKIVQSIKF